MQRMPGGITGFVGANCKRVLTNTLPSMLIHWENWGSNAIFIGLSDVNRPRHGDGENHCLNRRTGKIFFLSIMVVLATSYHKIEVELPTHILMTLLDIDEAKFIDFEQLKDETLPKLTVVISNTLDSTSIIMVCLYLQICRLQKKGSWFLDYEKKCDPN